MSKIKDIFQQKIKFEPVKFFKRLSKSKVARKIGIYSGSVLVVLAILFVGYNMAYTDRIYPKVFIGETDFGGMNRTQAAETLSKLIEENAQGELYFSFGEKKYSQKISDLAVNYSAQKEKTLDNLLGVGREGGLGKILGEELRSIFGHNQVYAGFTVNEEKLSEFLKTMAGDINIPVKDATIDIAEGQAKVTGEQIGRDFNLNENNNIAKETIGSFAFQKPAAFAVRQISPQILGAGAEKALPETKRLLALTIVLKGKEKEFKVTNKETAGFITFAKDGSSLKAVIDSTKVASYVDLIGGQVNQEAKDAKFSVEGGRVVTFQTSQTGYELDKEQTVKDLIRAYLQSSTEIELVVKVTSPKVNDDASTAGIKELIGEGRTSWRGSPPNRIHNLTLGATKISGTLVEPGQEFSTLHAIAPVTMDNGYLKELVIKNGNRVEPDVGGGLCQVSSTLFRAVIYSGLKVTARTAHSFRVSYYEPPIGMDATVFDPAPDFKFINDYPTPILIWAIAGNNSLVFQIYGTKDGRKIEISDPVTFDYTSPGSPIYTETATMAAGAIRQVERATPGASASFTYRVTAANGNVLENETFFSKYIPVPNSYLYGPGTTGIPGQEPAPAASPTSTPTPSPVKKGS